MKFEIKQVETSHKKNKSEKHAKLYNAENKLTLSISGSYNVFPLKNLDINSKTDVEIEFKL